MLRARRMLLAGLAAGACLSTADVADAEETTGDRANAGRTGFVSGAESAARR